MPRKTLFRRVALEWFQGPLDVDVPLTLVAAHRGVLVVVAVLLLGCALVMLYP